MLWRWVPRSDYERENERADRLYNRLYEAERKAGDAEYKVVREQWKRQRELDLIHEQVRRLHQDHATQIRKLHEEILRLEAK